jgi:uncharacterized membrane protein YeaQ/YmgE (transglycosylase-associated protein family)
VIPEALAPPSRRSHDDPGMARCGSRPEIACAAALAPPMHKCLAAMSIVLVLLIGLATGAVARLLMSADAPRAWAICTGLGVGGALAAYALACWLGDGTPPGERLALHASAIGGFSLLAMYRLAGDGS